VSNNQRKDAKAQRQKKAELTAQDTLKLPHEVAARFRPSDRFVVWVEGDTLHLKRITPPPVTSIVGQAEEEEPQKMIVCFAL
jgi:hypothetical protein